MSSTTDESEERQYQNIVDTASPETLLRVNEEAFERLSAQERSEAFDALNAAATDGRDRPADASPTALAKAATRQELHRSGAVAEALAGRDGDLGTNGLFATFVAFAIGSEAAVAFLALPALLPDADGSPPDFAPGFDADGAF